MIKYDSCCFFISASSGLVVLISSITDLLVLLAVHGILSSLLQHHNSKLSILLLSAFLFVRDSQSYNTTNALCCKCYIDRLSISCLAISFHMLVTPILEYGAVAWNPHTKNNVGVLLCLF